MFLLELGFSAHSLFRVNTLPLCVGLCAAVLLTIPDSLCFFSLAHTWPLVRPPCGSPSSYRGAWCRADSRKGTCAPGWLGLIRKSEEQVLWVKTLPEFSCIFWPLLGSSVGAPGPGSCSRCMQPGLAAHLGCRAPQHGSTQRRDSHSSSAHLRVS